MLSVAINSRVNPFIAYWLALIHSTCSSSLPSELWIITYANTRTELSRFMNLIFRYFQPFRKTSVLLKMNNLTLAEIFNSAAKIVCW